MKKLLNTILISIIFGYYNNTYYSSINTIYYDALTSSYDNICNYKIDENKTIINPIDNNTIINKLYGALYKEKNNIKYYLIDNNGKYYFDLQTKIDEVTEHNQELQNFTEGGNLIVKKCNNNGNTCTLKQNNTKYDYLTIRLLSDTNLVIPNNMLLNNKDVILKFCCNNGTVLILGTLQNTLQTDQNCYFINTSKNTKFNVIIGPQAKYIDKNTFVNSLIRMSNPELHNMVLYPGCTITCSNNEHNSNTTITYTGNLYLNRYTKPDNPMKLKLKGTIDNNIHVIYPAECAIKNSKWKLGYGLKTDLLRNNYMTTAYFPSLYWKKNNSESNHAYSIDGVGNYHFDTVCAPIEFIEDGDGCKILMLNSKNKFSQYDVKFWNQCTVNNGKYSFKEFVNIQNNIDKYINVDILENLFMDGKHYKQINSKYSMYGLLNNMPNTIYNCLIGSKNIVIHENNGGINTCTIHGDVSKYK